MSEENISSAAPPKPNLLDRIRAVARVRHLAYRTEEPYVNWVKRFVQYHDMKHPLKMGKAEVEEFLSYLAVRRNVAASTQNQALCAILFMYRHVLGRPLPWLDDVVRARRPKRLPVVLTRAEVKRLLSRLEGTPLLVAGLLYGAGLRLMEALRLRVHDLDFECGQVMIRDGKGGKDRITILPSSLSTQIHEHLDVSRATHLKDVANGIGTVSPLDRSKQP